MATLNVTFSELYKKYYNSELNYVRYQFTNLPIETLEEVINDSFLKVHNNLNEFDSNKSNIKTWIRNIVIRTAIDYYRANKDNMNVSGFDNDDEKNDTTNYFVSNDSADKGIESKELKKSILKAFATLKPKYQKIAELYFLNEMKYEEIATICEIPMNSVKVMIMRTKAMLQEQLINQKALYIG